MVSVAVSYGLGRHQYYLLITNPVNISNVIKWQLYSEPIAIFGGTIPKIAVTMLIIKLVVPHTLVRSYLWTLNILLNAVSVVCVVTSFVQCKPLATYWTRQGGTCWDPNIVVRLAISQGGVIPPSYQTEVVLTRPSTFGIHGLLSCHLPHHSSLEPPNGSEQKDRCMLSHGLR